MFVAIVVVSIHGFNWGGIASYQVEFPDRAACKTFVEQLFQASAGAELKLVQASCVERATGEME